MNELYPIKFFPIFKDKIWGGDKIRSVLNKDYSPLSNCGETWEVSSVEGDISVVSNGVLKGKDLKTIIQEYKGRLLGNKVFEKFGNQFPLLIKFIDAREDLSIQVHPDDEMASKRHGSFGKTEMWYVLQADEGSSVITGFNQEMDKDKYLKAFKAGTLMDILNREPAMEGDVFFIPAGRVHTLGKGMLIAEIQQTSDVTYRIFDFNRKDSEGNYRDLHVEEALDAMDYQFHDQYKTQYTPIDDEATEIVGCEYFTTSIISFRHKLTRNYHTLDSFKILIGTSGSAKIVYGDTVEKISKGEVILLPASMNEVILMPEGECRILETFVSLEK